MAFDKETKKSRGPAKGRGGPGKSGGGSRSGGPGSRGGSSRGPAKPRGESSFGERKPRSLPREGARSSRSEFSDRPKRDFGDRPKRDFGDRPPRREGSSEDRPKRSYSDRPRRDGDERPARREFSSDRPKRDFSDRPKRDFGDRPPRREGGSFEDRPKRSYSDRPRRDGDERPARREYSSDRPKRDFGDRPKRDFGDRPKRDFGDKPARREFSSDRPKRSYDDRPPRGDSAWKDRAPRRDSEDRPKRSYDDRPKRDFAPKKREGFEKRAPREIEGDQLDTDGVVKEERGEPTMMGHEMLFYGVHAVQAALRNEFRTITKIWVTESGQEKLDEAFDAKRHPEPIVVNRREIERRLPEGAVHQGLAVAVEKLQDVFLSDVINPAIAKPDQRHVVVVLDEVTDPHNVGAVLRSMSAFGAKAMIVHKRNAPGMTGVMAKIATGAVEHVPMIPVTNLAQALEELKLAGFFVLGLDENADFPIQKAPATGPIALVLGAEGEGLRAKTRTTCNAIASIETFGDIKSLNVSNAAAIALYTLTKKT